MVRPDRIQLMDAGYAVNYHPFGRDIAAAAVRSRPLLAEVGLDHGFIDGGCFAFARGLYGLLEAQREPLDTAVMVVGRPGIADHVVTRIRTEDGDLFADADGLGTRSDLLMKMRVLECFRGNTPLSIRGLDPGETGDDVIDYHEIGLPARITRALDEALGPIDHQRLSLDWAESPVPNAPSAAP